MTENIIGCIEASSNIDFSLKYLIENSSDKINFLFRDMKQENERNIKTLKNLYELLNHNESYSDINIDYIVENDYKHNLHVLFENTIHIINHLDKIKVRLPNKFYIFIVQNVVNSYVKFTAQISYIYSNLDKPQKRVDINNNDKNRDLEIARNKSIKNIYDLFGYELNRENIQNEYYEIFYDYSPDYKFYQYIFETDDRLFKTRISNNDNMLFHLYQYVKNAKKSVVLMSEEKAKAFVDDYLRNKVANLYDSLILDVQYLDTHSYSGSIEGYVFKYNFVNSDNTINHHKGIYVTVDSKYKYISEITYF